MFYVVKNLTRTVIMHPKYAYEDVDASFFTTVKRKSYLELEGSFDPFYGYIVTVIKYNNISREIILNSDGMLEVKISAKVVCQIPEIGEIVDAVVKYVSRASIIVNFCGIISCTIKASEFVDDDYVYMKIEKNDDEEKSPHTNAYFHLPSDPSKNIKIGSFVRVKIEERMIGSEGYFCTGTMNDGVNGFLGVIPSPFPNDVNSKVTEVTLLDQEDTLETVPDSVPTETTLLDQEDTLETVPDSVPTETTLLDQEDTLETVPDSVPTETAGDNGDLML